MLYIYLSVFIQYNQKIFKQNQTLFAILNNTRILSCVCTGSTTYCLVCVFYFEMVALLVHNYMRHIRGILLIFLIFHL